MFRCAYCSWINCNIYLMLMFIHILEQAWIFSMLKTEFFHALILFAMPKIIYIILYGPKTSTRSKKVWNCGQNSARIPVAFRIWVYLLINANSVEFIAYIMQLRAVWQRTKIKANIWKKIPKNLTKKRISVWIFMSMPFLFELKKYT